MRTVILAVLLISAAPAFASNERADRNMARARADAYRRAVLNYQWQRQLQSLRNDQQRARQNPLGNDTVTARLWQHRRQWQQQWEARRQQYFIHPGRPLGWR